MSESSTEWVVLARLLRPQGRRGELLADLLTDFPERFEPGAQIFLAPQDFDGPSSDAQSLTVTSAWLPHGRNRGRIVLGFHGIESIDSAEIVSGLDVIVAADKRVPLTDDSVYVDALIGCRLYDKDTLIGTVSGVQFMTTPDGKRRLEGAAALLVVEVPSGEILVPFAKDLLRSIELEQKSIHMNLPEGLLNLNASSDKGSSEPQREPE